MKPNGGRPLTHDELRDWERRLELLVAGHYAADRIYTGGMAALQTFGLADPKPEPEQVVIKRG